MPAMINFSDTPGLRNDRFILGLSTLVLRSIFPIGISNDEISCRPSLNQSDERQLVVPDAGAIGRCLSRAWGLSDRDRSP